MLTDDTTVVVIHGGGEKEIAENLWNPKITNIIGSIEEGIERTIAETKKEFEKFWVDCIENLVDSYGDYIRRMIERY